MDEVPAEEKWETLGEELKDAEAFVEKATLELEQAQRYLGMMIAWRDAVLLAIKKGDNHG